MTDLGDEPSAAPKLNIMPVYKTARLLDCVGIVRTNQRLDAAESPIARDDEGSVFWHPKIPLRAP
jgi:hypothetical protein